ncbi:unnamed protein product [Amoebophrya sp. A120]|nr:unnamed protein product [Amoebophrya sp. A120]|eukprot:GSA120T00024003001.1
MVSQRQDTVIKNSFGAAGNSTKAASATSSSSSRPTTASAISSLAAPGMRVRVFPYQAQDLAQVPGVNENEEAPFFGLLSKSADQQFQTDAAPNFVFDAPQTKAAQNDQWLARRVGNELHLFPAKGTFSFLKRVQTDRDLQTAMDRMKARDKLPVQDRKEWEASRATKPSATTEIDLAGATKRPYVRTGCEELDEENQYLQSLEDPSTRAEQKFGKEDPQFRKKRKLMEERILARKLDAAGSVPETAHEANFLKHTEDNEFDWDAEENDRFSDDEGNDGGEDENAAAELHPGDNTLADEEMFEKDDKYNAGEGNAVTRLDQMIKEEKDSEKAVDQVGGSDGPVRKMDQVAAAAPVDSKPLTIAEQIAKLFEKSNVVGIGEIMKALGIDGKTAKTSPKWRQTLDHLKANYTGSKNASGGFVFIKKTSK